MSTKIKSTISRLGREQLLILLIFIATLLGKPGIKALSKATKSPRKHKRTMSAKQKTNLLKAIANNPKMSAKAKANASATIRR